MIRMYSAAVLLALLAVPVALGQDAKPGDAMIEKYLAKETERLSQRVFDGATNLKEWEARRTRLKQEYLDMLGLWPLPEKTPLNAKVTGTVERDGIVIEKVYFQSRPGLYVTGNLYRPKETKGKLPTVLYVCGHSGRGRDGNKTAFQDHGLWFATNGYVCLVIDTLQLGEVAGIHHGTYGIRGTNPVEVRWWWQALGYTPAGVECWNGVRAIDYLISRPDVDADRIAVTGISGGGAATFWIAAADERVKCAVPVSGMSDLESYVTNKVINGHCDCMFLVNTYGWEWTTIAALVAPRPLLFANSDNDKIFPMDGNRRIIDRLRKLYKMYDKSELVDEYVSKGGHDYRPDLRIAIFKWINKHIKNDTGDVKDADFKPLPGKELRVFPEDGDIPKDAINGKIDETFVSRAQVKLPEKGKFEEWKKDMLAQLKAKSFRKIPEDVVNANEIFTVQSSHRGGSKRVVVFFMEPDAYKKLGSFEKFVKEYTEEGDSWELWFPRFYSIPLSKEPGSLSWEEVHSWTKKSPPNYVERSHVLLGRTIDELKVYRLIASVKNFTQNIDGIGKPEKVVAIGQAGILAAYAALLEPSIKEVVIIDPPVSHKDGPTFLNVLRVLDVPEALGLLAPTPLTLVNAKDKAFDRTAEIYKLAGAEGKLQRK